jgi:hypothetical protein
VGAKSLPRKYSSGFAGEFGEMKISPAKIKSLPRKYSSGFAGEIKVCGSFSHKNPLCLSLLRKLGESHPQRPQTAAEADRIRRAKLRVKPGLRVKNENFARKAEKTRRKVTGRIGPSPATP